MRPLIHSALLSLLLCVVAASAALAAHKGDPAAGEAKAAPCAECHGPQGNSVQPAWPKLAGQGAAYLVQQIRMFKARLRLNPLMAPQVESLTEQDMHDIAAYYSKQKMSPGAADKRLVDQGREIYRGGLAEKRVPACLSCHGPDGAGNPAAKFPRLSFQHATYLTNRLKAYRAGVAYPGSEIMNDVARRLSDKEIEALSSYIQGLH